MFVQKNEEIGKHYLLKQSLSRSIKVPFCFYSFGNWKCKINFFVNVIAINLTCI